ncbi:MAG: AAA family ATPase, partial [Candidatus Pacebacteria bacterium]|nr:AAA family ATPase [Candidatus Paceibacterota bacterium]
MKILKKVIALILIQAFLCMNVAFAGGIELLSSIDQNQQSSTLSPQAQISVAQFQIAFDLIRRKYGSLEALTEKTKDPLGQIGNSEILPIEEPVYEGSKFLIVRENGKEYLVYRDPDTGEERIKIERGAHDNKLIPDIEWNPAFENEQNIGILIHMFQILYAEDGQKDDVMRNLILVGEAGTGKDVLAEYAVKLLNRNRRVLSIHKRTDKNQLVARRIFFTEKTKAGKTIRRTGWANSELIEAA